MIRRILVWLGSRRPIIALAARIQTPIDRTLMGATRGRLSLLPTLPTLVLVTTGRRTGERREAPLMYVETADGGYGVTDTNYGREPRPGWSHNLVGDATCSVDLAGDEIPAVARLATGEERDAAWDRLVALWPPYAAYAERLSRSPHVWVLTPDD